MIASVAPPARLDDERLRVAGDSEYVPNRSPVGHARGSWPWLSLTSTSTSPRTTTTSRRDVRRCRRGAAPAASSTTAKRRAIRPTSSGRSCSKIARSASDRPRALTSAASLPRVVSCLREGDLSVGMRRDATRRGSSLVPADWSARRPRPAVRRGDTIGRRRYSDAARVRVSPRHRHTGKLPISHYLPGRERNLNLERELTIANFA